MRGLLPEMRQFSKFFIYQQDGALSHRARETVNLLSRETPDFISASLWPPNSPDLNPVDYKVWGILQECIYKTRVKDVEELWQRILLEWDRLDQKAVDEAFGQWRARLRVCIDAAGGHSEYKLL